MKNLSNLLEENKNVDYCLLKSSNLSVATVNSFLENLVNLAF